jgi:hypothetical protein
MALPLLWVISARKERHAGSMAQVIECLPSKCKALSSNPITAGKKKRKRKETPFIECL